MVAIAPHVSSLATSTELSRYYVVHMIPPVDVVRVLNRENVSFVLVGLHGLAGWMKEPRATEDVDVIVASKQHRKAVRLLLEAFPELEAVELEVVTRLRRKGTDQVLIDVMKPVQEPHRSVFKNVVAVETSGVGYRIPSLEMAVAMKFAPMVSPNRQDEDKFQDAHDFILLVKKNPEIDLDKLSGLAEAIYSGAGAEIREMVRRVRAGERLKL